MEAGSEVPLPCFMALWSPDGTWQQRTLQNFLWALEKIQIRLMCGSFHYHSDSPDQLPMVTKDLWYSNAPSGVLISRWAEAIQPCYPENNWSQLIKKLSQAQVGSYPLHPLNFVNPSFSLFLFIFCKFISFSSILLHSFIYQAHILYQFMHSSPPAQVPLQYT